jgi:hypothetical protein
MPEPREIDYIGLIDRLIPEFRPAKPLWPVGLRLALWSLLGAAVVAAGIGLGSYTVPLESGVSAGIVMLFLVGAVAAFVSLRSAIPDRATSLAELLALAIAAIGALALMRTEGAQNFLPAASADFGALSIMQTLGLGAFPWLALFWAVRRGMPLRPRSSGAIIGIAGFCFSLAADKLLFPRLEATPFTTEVISGALVVALSAAVGSLCLDLQRIRSIDLRGPRSRLGWSFLGSPLWFPAATAASAVLTICVLMAGARSGPPVPDFDLAIAGYEQSLNDFHPNVPSDSIETVLTAYIEHGMAPYMWDFGPQGFKLVGGRLERLSDGTPVAYTWFRGSSGGVMCLMRPTAAFQPPPGAHEENQHVLFYRYRGFSVAMLNVGGYGSFVSVIVAPTPMRQFMPLILGAVR